MRRYAIPVDATRVLIRARPATPLEVVSTGVPGEVQVFVAQPPPLPALRPAEARALQAYFRWDETPAFWRRTLYPAVFRTERVDTDQEVGYLLEPGETVALAGEPARRPAAGNEPVFGVYREPVPSGVVREPWGPERLRSRDGKILQVSHSPVARVYLARFPGFGGEMVWLKLLGGTAVRPAHVEAFGREADLLARLADLRPGAAAAVVHRGVLGLESYNGPYTALRPPVGVELAALPRGGGRLWPSRPDALFAQIADDLLRTLSAVHHAPEPGCVGVISLDSLRFRPGRTPEGRRVQTVLLAAPAAGPPGTPTAASVLEMLPDGTSGYLRDQFELPYERSVAGDLRSLGFALEQISATLGESAAPVRDFVGALKVGAFASADAARQSLF